MPGKQTLTEITAEIVAAHVSNNSVAVSELPNLIQCVHEALNSLQGGSEQTRQAKNPVVSVRASIKPEYLVCMECGSKQKTLKRHLQAAHGMSPKEYRQDYGLPDSYPMSAPNYSERRRAMAQKIGLGRKPGEERSPRKTRQRKAESQAYGTH